MKTLLPKTTLILLIILAAWNPSTAQNNPLEKISLAIGSGNAKALVEYFDSRIEITILDSEKSYSKAQGEQVIRDFFTKYPPTSFTIIHDGSAGNSMFGIGTLVTSKGTFRTNIYYKKVDSAYYIHILSFAND